VLDDPAAGVFVAPEHRPVSLMFQDGVLFRHLSALDNVAFGLRARGVRKSAANARAQALLERLGLGAEARAKPGALSGGQAQRVALARALAVEPHALLLDEPLAALDARTRVDVRRMLREQLATFDGTRVLVTHDPLEALTMADRIVVVEAGRVVQTGTPEDIRRHPQSPYVAALLGVNLLAGRLAGGGRMVLDAGGELHVTGDDTGPAIAIIDPNAISLFRARPEGSARNCWQSVVADVDRAPDRVRVHFAAPLELVADVTPAAAAELALAPGMGVKRLLRFYPLRGDEDSVASRTRDCLLQRALLPLAYCNWRAAANHRCHSARDEDRRVVRSRFVHRLHWFAEGWVNRDQSGHPRYGR
jgi:molybdate transport system ATP-binding protein